MIRSIIGAVLPIGLLFSATGALAQERCLATYYRLPPNIAEDVRPYLLCGLIHDQPDTGTTVNGVRVLMHGQSPASCGDVRARAFAAANQHLAPTMRDTGARRRFLDAEFKKADEFLRTTTKLDDVGIGEEPTAPRCRTQNAGH